MKIAVTDANIFIDLIRLDMLYFLFELDLELHTTQNVIDELNERQFAILSQFIKNNSINIHMLNEDELRQTITINVSRKLSPQDVSVIALALRLKAIVLTGDNLLRKYCQKEDLKVHGILWLFDSIILKEIISKSDAIIKLELLISQNNRLPKDECNKRLNDWKK